MKNILIFIAIITLLFSSCKDEDFLNTKPLGEYSSVDFWKSPGLIDQFINGIYLDAFGYPYNFFGVGLCNYSGNESWFSLAQGVSDFNKCNITSDYIPFWEDPYSRYALRLTWGNLYASVRKTNLFFENVKNTNFKDEAERAKYLGQVYFLRGVLYHYLSSVYGGVPIITKAFQLNDDFNVPRNSYPECIDFIVGQLDSAAMYLPESYAGSELGRATKGAALTFKSRVLLYAASDLHQNTTSYAPGYSNPELLGYVGADRSQLWQKAKDAAKAVIDLGMYSLYKSDPAPGDSIAQNIAEYFISRNMTSEDILLRNHTALSATKISGDGNWINHQPYMTLYPNGYHGWGGVQPTSDQADSYEMKDGSPFDWNNPVYKAQPYANRDARFYATLLYEGSSWAIRPEDVRGMDPWNQMQNGYVEYKNSSGENQTLRGADNGRVDDWSNGIYTGYFLRKGFDPNVDYTKTKEDVPFRVMRYAEVLLNYAEACIELGQDGEARSYINMIRNRAGQPDIPSSVSSDELKRKYRNERRVELSFEDHRFFDVRRWLIGSEAYSPIHKVLVKYTTTQNAGNSYRQPDGSNWSAPSYSIGVVDDYAWDNKAYFLPIKRDEIFKNDKLVQNPGY